jgi:hypothetical protein
MKIVVKFSKGEEIKALPILLRHSPGIVLPDRTYVIEVEAARALRRARVRFTELARDGEPHNAAGATIR